MEQKPRIRQKVAIVAVILSGLLTLMSGAVQANSPAGIISGEASAKINKIAPEVQQAVSLLQADEMTTVIVTLKAQANVSAITGQNRQDRNEHVIIALQNMADATQKRIIALLQAKAGEGKVGQFESYWVFNGLAVTATADVVAELGALPEVDTITPNSTLQEPAPQTGGGGPEPNLVLINAPALWNLGLQGQGIVVANMDTGVDVTHPDLSAQWRGGSNSWFDPYGEHPATPTDVNGHGTWTMGTMVGRDAGGTAIGVAPQAQWIAVKIFKDDGTATVAGIHAGYQWLLDPDGNPATDDSPHVVNNSWTYQNPGCNLEFQQDLIVLRAMGVLPVFAAGNFGPGAGTSASPANYPEAFAVGGINNSDQIYTYSSRGPSACGESSTTFPEIVAPGVTIRTTDLYSLYINASGTSLAAPHVAGGLALLLGLDPNLTADQQETALLNSTVDLGDPGPDDVFGQGRLNLLAAYQWLTNNNSPTPTPVPGQNLALDKPFTVSSFQDPGHEGSMAVDGDLATLWQTAKATGKNKLPSEWITIDLGSSVSVSRVVLEWEANFATNYTLQISNNNTTWAPLFATTTGDGGNDTITFDPTTVRYMKLDSTAWSNSSQRNWLKEFEIYADAGGGSEPTSTPTDTPTSTATPTATPTSVPPTGSGLYLSLNNGGSYTVGAVADVSDEDVLSFDGTNFAMLFDGSDVGVSGLNVDAFDYVYTNTLLLSFDNDTAIGGLGPVDDSDIVQFNATSLGDNTAGTFSLYFDGSDVGLTTNTEDVDAVNLLPDGRLVVSTAGNTSVPGLNGKQQDEDLLIFNPTSLGGNTSGSWELYFDGSDVDLANSQEENITGVAIGTNGDIYLTTLSNFAVASIAGGGEDVFTCTATTLGNSTVCSYASALFFDGSAWGLTGSHLDALDLPD
ncbi:MAG: S8 family serine peptidase [Anaerolineae bacterium]|nr:S8 family serine peptidase [Anaerolineae bacterium]